MKKLIILLSTLCLMASFAGCGDKATTDENDYRLKQFSFSAPEGFSQGEHEKTGDDEEIYIYEFFDPYSTVEISVLELYNNTKPEAFMDNCYNISGFPWQYIEDCGYTAAMQPMSLASGNSGISAYVFSENCSLCVEAHHFDKDDEQTAEKAVEEVVRSAYYFSDFHLPTAPQKYKNKYFSIEYDPKFYLAEDQTKRNSKGYFYDVRLEDSIDTRLESGYNFDSDMKNCEKCVFMSYSQAETVMRSTLDLSVCVFSHDYYEHCGVAVSADYNVMAKYDRCYSDLEMSEAYFGEYPSYENNCIFNEDQKMTCVYFDKGDYMYKIEYSYPLDDPQAAADMQELLDGIEIR